MAKEQNFEHPPRGHVALLYYDPTNDRFQVVQGDDVDTAIPAAGKSLLASVLAHGYDGSTWRKLNLLWGYYDRWVEDLGGTATDAQYQAASTAVPPGYIYVPQIIGARNIDRAITFCHIILNLGGVVIYAKSVSTLARYIPIGLSGQFTMKEGDTVQVILNGNTAGDTIEAGVTGYMQRINQ